MSDFTAAAERHAKWSRELVGHINRAINAYHETRKSRPLGEKMKLGCIAFMFFWVPFLIPFLIYSYLYLALAAVLLYASLVMIVWKLSVGFSRLRGKRDARAARVSSDRLSSDSHGMNTRQMLKGLEAQVRTADFTRERDVARISAALAEAEQLLPADERSEITRLRRDVKDKTSVAQQQALARAEDSRRAVRVDAVARVYLLANPTWQADAARNVRDNASVWSSSWIKAYDLSDGNLSNAAVSAALDQATAEELLRGTLDDAVRNRLAAGIAPSLLTGNDSALLAWALDKGTLPSRELLEHVEASMTTSNELEALKHESTQMLLKEAQAKAIAGGIQSQAFSSLWQVAFQLGLADGLISVIRRGPAEIADSEAVDSPSE